MIVTDKLGRAVIVEYEEGMDPKQAVSLVVGTNVPFACMSFLSHTKFILFFDTEMEMMNAMDKVSPLWKIFADVHRWSEGECYSDRLVWIECFGLHPKCWSFENIKTIGEKWGRVLHVDHDDNGVNSLTFARLLVRTKVQNRIEACIKMEWDSGYCDVWVKEAPCAYKTMGILNQSKEESNCDEMEDRECELRECGQPSKTPELSKIVDTVGINNEKQSCNPIQM